MSLRQRKSIKALAIFVAFAIAQISIQMSFASTAAPSYAPLVQQQLLVKISTSGNRPILVNGNSTPSGGSLATGATIEMPEGVSATRDLGPLGTLDLAPNSKVVLEFDCPPAPPGGSQDNANCNVKVKVLAGCVVLKTKKGTHGQTDSEQQEKVQENDNKKGGGAPLNYCTPGAGAATAAGVAAATVATGGLAAGTVAAGVVAAGVLVGGLIIANNDGGNPSPGAP